MQDREWKQRANPKAWNASLKYEATDMRMLEKRKKQKLLQNIALEAQYKIHVKKPKY